MNPLVRLLLAAGVVLVAAYLAGRIFNRITVFEYERGLKYRKGKLNRVLGAGVYWIFAPQVKIVRIDIRPRLVAVPGQEIITADGVSLKLSLAAKFQVVDPEIAINRVESYQDALYLGLQLALRDIASQTLVDDLLAKRNEYGVQLLAAVKIKAEAIGLELLSVDLKDVMFPGQLKQLFAQSVQARKQGQAALEKARGETAALRNLANAARLVEQNPSLLPLRFLHSLNDSTGNTLVVNLGPDGGAANAAAARPAAKPDREPVARGSAPDPESDS
jgi:regulator of protease activity HflC (stomatin/prohibitin superfamily)